MSLRSRAIGLAGATVIGLAAAIVQHFEGYEPKAYVDPVGIPTICWGHTDGVKIGQALSEAQCLEILGQDLLVAQKAVDRLVKVPMTNERRAALISFVFNAGEGNFAKSTILRKLNQGDTRGACAEISRWVYAGGKKLAGLVKRRAEERHYCEVGLDAS